MMTDHQYQEWLCKGRSALSATPHCIEKETATGEANGPLADPFTMSRWVNTLIQNDFAALNTALEICAAITERMRFMNFHEPNMDAAVMAYNRVKGAGLKEFENELRRMIAHQFKPQRDAIRPTGALSGIPRAGRAANRSIYPKDNG